MDLERVRDLLTVWDESWATLPRCRETLNQTGWDPVAACTVLFDTDTARYSADTEWSPLPKGVDPLELYQRVGSRLHDWIGEEPSNVGMLFATLATNPHIAMAPNWTRHRFFAGFPTSRYFKLGKYRKRGTREPARSPEVLLYGGVLRLKPDMPEGPPSTRSAIPFGILSSWDAGYMMRQLTRMCIRENISFAVNILGAQGVVSSSGPDETLIQALREVSPSGDANHRGALSLLDRYPNRTRDGLLERYEKCFFRAEQVLMDVELAPPTESDAAVGQSFLEPLSGLVDAFVAIRRSAQKKPQSTPYDILDRLLIEYDVLPTMTRWQELSRPKAIELLRKVFTTFGDYGPNSRLKSSQAKPLIADFVSGFREDAQFFISKSGEFEKLLSIEDAGVAKGVAMVDEEHVGLLLVGDHHR